MALVQGCNGARNTQYGIASSTAALYPASLEWREVLSEALPNLPFGSHLLRTTLIHLDIINIDNGEQHDILIKLIVHDGHANDGTYRVFKEKPKEFQ